MLTLAPIRSHCSRIRTACMKAWQSTKPHAAHIANEEFKPEQSWFDQCTTSVAGISASDDAAAHCRRPLASKRRASVWRPPAERRPRRALLRVGGIPIPKQDPSSDGLAAQMVLRVSRVCTEPRRASAVPEGWLRLAFRQGEYARRVYANETPNASSRSPHRRQPQSFSSCYTRARSLMCSRGWECSQEDAAIRSWPNRIWHALLRCPVFS